MRLTPTNEKDRIHLLAVSLILIVTFLSMFGAWWLGNDAKIKIETDLGERSQSIASALDTTHLSKLKGDTSDDGTPAYTDLKTQLAAIKRANPDARSVYLMGRHQNGELFFYDDSEPPTSHDYSPAGDLYPDGTAADKAIFDNGQAFVEGPTTDTYGTFISGLAPIFKPGANQVAAVLGIDISADTYWHDIIYSAALPLVIGVMVILIVLIFERIRRHNVQLLALRSELVSVASHELRNPITGIRWAAESLVKLTSDERVLKMSKAILDSAMRLQASTNDILELSHASSDRPFNKQKTDISKLVQEVIETQSLSAQQKNVSLTFDQYWPKNLIVQCDPDQMRRAIHNVISNAIKYTRSNTPVVISYKQDDKHHTLLVTDQGIGIPSAEQNKVFRGFYRASNAAKSNIPGTGLGLYLVKTVFERHGGSVSFVSEENKGTTFMLTLPKS
jgi:signal transduction histidine kinase